MAQVQMSDAEYAARLERKLARQAIELEALHEELDRRMAAEKAAEIEAEPEKPVRLARQSPKLVKLPDGEQSPGA